MVLLLSLASVLAATPNGSTSQDRYDSYREVPAERWEGADPEILVQNARAAPFRLKPRVDRNLEYGLIYSSGDMAQRLARANPSVEFTTNHRGRTVVRFMLELGSWVTFQLPDVQPDSVKLGSPYYEGLRPATPGETAPWAEAAALAYYQSQWSGPDNLSMKRLIVAGSIVSAGQPLAGVAMVMLSGTPPGCVNPYYVSVGWVELSLETRDLLSAHRSVIAPVRPGDVPSIDMFEAEARVAAAWQRHLAWPGVRIEVEPAGYWFVAANRWFAAHERTPGQQRCAEEGKWILMYRGRIWDPASARPGKHPSKVCYFQVDAVEGNVINFLDASPLLQNLGGMLLGSEEETAPLPSDPPTFDPAAARAVLAPGRATLKLDRGLRSSPLGDQSDRPEGAALTIHASGLLWEGVASSGALWGSVGAKWRAYEAPNELAEWLNSPVSKHSAFGRPLPPKAS